jgi:hypothetical protein
MAAGGGKPRSEQLFNLRNLRNLRIKEISWVWALKPLHRCPLIVPDKNETSSSNDPRGFSVAECREWLEADVLARLQRFSALQMGMAERLAAEAEEEDADPVRLSAAMAKAGRAVRLTAILQLEVAGLRRQAGSREPAQGEDTAADEPAPESASKPEDTWDRARLGPYEHMIEDTQRRDAERIDRELKDELDRAHDKLRAAMDEDLRAAGKLLELNQSIATKARDYIRHIPHPATDACIRSLSVAFATYIFGNDNLEPARLKTGPPDTPPRWFADRLSPEELDKEMQRRGYG